MRKTISLLIFSTLILCSSAFSEQNVPMNIPAGGAADLLNMTSTPPELQDTHLTDDHVRRYCTDKYGRVVQQADPNYADCLRNRKSDAPPQKPSTDQRSAGKAAGAP